MEEKHIGWILIPPQVMSDKRLTPSAKMLYGKINGLIGERGYCWASNETLAFYLGMGDIRNPLEKLVSTGYIKRVVFKGEGNERHLYPLLPQLQTSVATATDPSVATATDTMHIDYALHKACVLEKLKSDTGSVSGGQYSPDGFSPVDRLAMKRRAEKALGFKRANKWSQLLFGSAWDFRTAFKKYEGYDYPDPILLDEVAKTLAHWFELGETRDSIRDMLIAFFEGKKHEKVTITPNSVFSSHTYNSWKQNKL